MIRSKEEALFRADVYRVLSIAFAYPSSKRLRHLDEIIRDMTEGEKPDGANEGIWNALLKLRGSFPEDRWEGIEGEYNRLFAAEVAVSSHESSYGLMDKGSVLSDVGGFYRAFGLDASKAKEPPDSMGHELEFMSIMALKEVYGIERGLNDEVKITRDAEITFLREHLGRWFHPFVSKLEEGTGNPFYLSAGQLLERWLRSELEDLSVEPFPLSPLEADGGDDRLRCPADGPA